MKEVGTKILIMLWMRFQMDLMDWSWRVLSNKLRKKLLEY